MEISYHKGLYAMDSIRFTIDGTDFNIIESGYNEQGIFMCCVKNVETGKYKDIEQQRLCRLILADQKKREAPVFVSKNVKTRQTGLGI